VKPEGMYNDLEAGYVVERVDSLITKGYWKTHKYHLVEPFWYYDSKGRKAIGAIHDSLVGVTLQLYDPETKEPITYTSPVFFHNEKNLAKEWLELEMDYEHGDINRGDYEKLMQTKFKGRGARWEEGGPRRD